MTDRVWIVSEGCRYEGGEVHSVHATRESALVAVEKLLARRKTDLDEQRAEAKAQGTEEGDARLASAHRRSTSCTSVELVEGDTTVKATADSSLAASAAAGASILIGIGIGAALVRFVLKD